MATLVESASWVAGIYQLETSDPVLGGADGIDNLQAKQLANRTLWLKSELEQRATPADIQTAVAALVASSPATLDTLQELAAALGDDPNFATTVTSALAAKAQLASPALTGTPTAPTAAPGTNTTQLATTAFVTAVQTLLNAAVSARASLASPVFTGTPSAPTAAVGTNGAQIATTAFVQAAVAALVGSSPAALDTLKELADALGNDANFAATMTNLLALKAPLLSPALSGVPTAPTAAAGTNSLQLATTAFVRAALDSADAPGTMSIHAGNTPPPGKLKANGAAVSRTGYSALFAALVTAAGFTPQAVTMTIASPGVFTKTAHGLYPGARVRLATTGTLPTGLDTSTDYFVETIDANSFYLSATLMGARIATTGTQTGAHTFLQSWFGLGDGVTTFNLPDMRGEGIRGFDDGRGVDSGRGFGSAQLDALQNITGSIIAYSSASGAFAIGGGAGNSQGGGAALSVISFDASRVARTSTETRGRNLAFLICIKY